MATGPEPNINPLHECTLEGEAVFALQHHAIPNPSTTAPLPSHFPPRRAPGSLTSPIPISPPLKQPPQFLLWRRRLSRAPLQIATGASGSILTPSSLGPWAEGNVGAFLALGRSCGEGRLRVRTDKQTAASPSLSQRFCLRSLLGRTAAV